MNQLTLDFSSTDDRDDGFPCKDGRWLHISYPARVGYGSIASPHRTLKSAVRRAATLLKESPEFWEAIEIKLLK